MENQVTEKIKTQIDKLYADTSTPENEILEALEEISDVINEYINEIKK